MAKGLPEINTLSQWMSFQETEKEQFLSIIKNQYFAGAVVEKREKSLTIAKDDGKYTMICASYQEDPEAPGNRKTTFESAQDLLKTIQGEFPLIRVKVIVSVPEKYQKELAKIDRSCASVPASAGRRLSKRTKFTESEMAYCRKYSQLYAKRVALSMDTRLTQLNLNTLVLGGSGAGKSRFFVVPNLLQANSSYVVTDPSGELMLKTGKYLKTQGYEIRCLNIEDMGCSMRYNPFAYVYEDSDIPVMVDAMISNIEGPKKGTGGDNKFWDETARTLLIAICGYLFETQPMEKRNFNNVIKLIDMMDVSDERTQPMDELDKLFNDLEQANPGSYAVSNYKVIKSAGTGKTAQNIVISTLAIFARFFKLDKIANLTYKDELHLEELGQKKVALFIVTPQGDTTYNFLASELYTQLFDLLYKQGKANARRKSSVDVSIDVPVRCLIDEAANIGVIPHLPEKLSSMRKYGISCCLIYQNQAQIKSLMKDDWETIAGNCDTMLFLGGIDGSTVKLVSERLGKGTIHTKNQTLSQGAGLLSMGLGSGRNNSTSIQSTGRNLKDTNELEQMPLDRCIVFIRSMKPFEDEKYPLEKHPAYPFCGEADEAFAYQAPFHLKYDYELMASLDVKRVGEEGYEKPGRRNWVKEEDVKRVRADQENRKERAEEFRMRMSGMGIQLDDGGRDADDVLRKMYECAVKTPVKPPMSEKEKARVKKMIEEKKINLLPEEAYRLFSMRLEDALEFLELKDGYAPAGEFDFTEEDFKIPVAPDL